MTLQDNPTSYEAILSNLSLLDQQLSSLDLTQFLVFNRSYIVVTQTIKRQSDANFFKCSSQVEQFTASFAQHYFRAMNEIITNATSQSAAWDKLLQAKSHPHSIQLLMGANAHINHDLPLTMVEFLGKSHSKELFQDILSIDRLLIESGREIIGLFDEPHTCMSFAKRHLRFLYFTPILYMILSWRISAYKSAKMIKKYGHSSTKFQTKSIRIANRLFGIGLLLKF